MKNFFLKISRKLSFFQIRFLLIILYVFIISPIALIWKLIRKDPLSKRWDGDMNSYMLKYDSGEVDINKMERPY